MHTLRANANGWKGSALMNRTQVEIPVQGMDCTECTQHVQQALETLPGVENVCVLLSAEKAILQIDPLQVDVAALCKAVEGAGYSVPLQTLELCIQGMDYRMHTACAAGALYAFRS